MNTAQKIRLIQSAAFDAAADKSRDYALISFAFIELALIIAVATRAPSLSKLDHRDKVLEAVRTMHEHAWDDAAELYEKIRKDTKG